MNIRLIENLCTDPAWNIAADEYYLTECPDFVAAIWRNDRSVIIGKNQNALAEIDFDFVTANRIPVIRRLSGGGAVFHDLGNINFTFTCPYSEEAFSDYARFAAPICDYLRTLGLDAQLSGRNDITIDGRKISGNAQAVRNGRMMSHGTMLYSANLGRLAGALRPDPEKIAAKGIRSVRSRVGNIAELLPDPPPVEDFFAALVDYLAAHLPNVERKPLTEAECAVITEIANTRFRTDAWNYGAEPPYTSSKKARYPYGSVQLQLDVKDGIIRTARITGDFFGSEDVAILEAALAGLAHRPEVLQPVLEQIQPSRFISGASAADLLSLAF